MFWTIDSLLKVSVNCPRVHFERCCQGSLFVRFIASADPRNYRDSAVFYFHLYSCPT